MINSEQPATEQRMNADSEQGKQNNEKNPTEVSPPLWDRSILCKPNCKELIKMQSIPLDIDPSVRRSPRVKDENHLFGTMKEGVYTLHDVFMCGYHASQNANCLGWRSSITEPYKWATYQEIYEMVCKVGSGLIEKGAKTNQEQLIGIYSRNGLPWFVLDRACSAYSMVSVPLYDSLGPEALTHIVKQCELGIIMVDTNDNAMKLLKDAKEGKTDSLKLIVLVDDERDDVKDIAREISVEVLSFEKLQDIGTKCLCEFVPPKPNDLFTICYTSGTTGQPKGAMHSHKNGVAGISAYLVNAADYQCEFTPDDVYFSYLPQAHVLERYFQCGLIMHGGKIGFFSGDPKKLLDDASALKPTVFPMVPRVLNRIHSKIYSLVGQSGLKRMFFDFCLSRKMARLKQGIVESDSFWDKILFHKFRAAVGGRVKFGLSGAAPITPEVLNVIRCVLGFPMLEAYGQTESTAALTATLHGDFTGGNVGTILPNMIVKLVDVPEKEYYAKDNKGEICCKGLSIFQGYYKDEAKTKEAIDEDGWLHTGDIGEWLPNGSLKIIDRRKNIFKLSHGEYIAPEKIEQIYQLCTVVGQVYVHGISLKSSLIVIVVPDEETITEWCKDKGINVDGQSFSEICEMEEVSANILKDMNEKGKHHGLKSFELAKKIHLSCEPFTIENGLLTPTLKSRRVIIEKKYEAKINEMYSGME